LLSPIQINQSNDNESLHIEWTPENISHEVWKSIIILRITLSLQSTITGRYTAISLQTSHNISHNSDNNSIKHRIATARVLNIRPYIFILQNPEWYQFYQKRDHWRQSTDEWSRETRIPYHFLHNRNETEEQQ